MEEKRNLVFLSGGFTSTALAVKSIKENPSMYTDIVHLTLKKESIDWKKELDQSRKINKWLESKFSNFTYKEYVFDATSLILKKSEAVEIYAGFIVTRSRKQYSKIIVGVFKDDLYFIDKIGNDLTKRTLYTTAIFNAQPSLTLMNIELPVWDLESYDSLQEDLEEILRKENFPFVIFN